MRKSKRIKQLELEVLQLKDTLEFTNRLVGVLMESSGLNKDLDAGKWYTKPEND